jgi:ribosomal protein S18 acetylase RimI-like enzyme
MFWKVLEMNIQEKIIEIAAANDNNIIDIAHLFNDYRIFYNKQSDIEGAKKFIFERFQNKESFIFSAFLNKEIVGFTQVYPTFSSVGMKQIYVLNDLYTHENFRSLGVGRSLIQHVKEFAQKNNVSTIILETASNNFTAKSLYESFGFSKENGMDVYSLNFGAIDE